MTEAPALSVILTHFQEAPGSLEEGCRSLELRETHLSAVLLSEKYAYKFKKAVDYGFVTQKLPAERLLNCNREVELNRRTAPDVYLGVRFVHEGARGFELSEVEAGYLEPCVVMRRLDEEDSLLSRVVSGRVRPEEIDRVAAFLADFHANCRRGPDVTALHTFEKNQAENLEAIAQFLESDGGRSVSTGLVSAQELERFEHLPGLLDIYGRDNLHRVLDRERRGCILDGHGDLRLDHIYLERGEIRIIDCVEFNEGFRAVDPFEDLAFAGMGLKMEGRQDLGQRLELAYTARTADVRGWTAAPLFEVYRACVRAKVDAIQARAPGDPKSRARRRFFEYLRLLEKILEREQAARVCKLFVVGGLPAVGKSTLAGRLSREHAAPVVATDIVRKRLAGRKPEEYRSDGAFQGIYSPRVGRYTYARARGLAGVLLADGRSAVLDGTFGRRTERAAVRRLAERYGAQFVFYEVTSPEDVIRARLAERTRGPSVSDLHDFGLWQRFREHYEPPGEELGDALLRVEGFS